MQHRADFERARRAADADPAAFESLWSDSFERVHAFVARRTASPGAAQRVSERALTRLFESLDRYTGGMSFARWSLAITLDELRGEACASRPSAPAQATGLPPDAGG